MANLLYQYGPDHTTYYCGKCSTHLGTERSDVSSLSNHISGFEFNITKPCPKCGVRWRKKTYLESDDAGQLIEGQKAAKRLVRNGMSTITRERGYYKGLRPSELRSRKNFGSTRLLYIILIVVSIMLVIAVLVSINSR